MRGCTPARLLLGSESAGENASALFTKPRNGRKSEFTKRIQQGDCGGNPKEYRQREAHKICESHVLRLLDDDKRIIFGRVFMRMHGLTNPQTMGVRYPEQRYLCKISGCTTDTEPKTRPRDEAFDRSCSRRKGIGEGYQQRRRGRCCAAKT